MREKKSRQKFKRTCVIEEMMMEISNTTQELPSHSKMTFEHGAFDEELITNLPHYRQVIAFQEMDNTSSKINVWALSIKTEGTTIWTRVNHINHWMKEERLISYFMLENDEPVEYIVYQEKKINMLNGKMMYLKMKMATPFVLKYNKIKLFA